jgi:ATP-dependent helicase/nuclease subunit B
MSPIASDRLDEDPVDRHFWPAVAERVRQWLSAQGVSPRDAVVMLPYAGLLPVAREAFAQLGGWQPRIETTQTLAASLAPVGPTPSGEITFDSATDGLTAGVLLRSQATGAAWARRDPRGFASAVAAVVRTAHTLLRGVHQRAPAARAAYWAGVREAMGPATGPGASERWLARVALEWAASADAPIADILWAWRPAAWIALQAGGRDALVDRLLAAARDRAVPVLLLDADPPVNAPFDAAACLTPPRRLRCAGLEEEAQAATLAVLEALDRGQSPVALIAQDRLVVRRMRALLERAQVTLHDETGWALSTTRAAARLMALLRAAAHSAGRDALLDWLKADASDAAALAVLESQWRRGGDIDGAAEALQRRAQDGLQALRGSVRRTLARWLSSLQAAAPNLLQALADDAAGRQLLAALHLDGLPAGAAWLAAVEATSLDLGEFTAWVDDVLEVASFVPPAQPKASVVITPLERALLRPFGAVVFPGCDEKRLGAAAAQPTLLPEALLREFGLAHAAERHERESAAFAHLLRVPHLTLLRRDTEGGEPLAASALVERAWQVRRRLGQPAPDEQRSTLPRRAVTRAPVSRPAPAATQAVPARLSASAVEALRACPYRFFALNVLGLRESPELEIELEKRDFGTWLHGVLLRFHRDRPETDAALSDLQCLIAAADTEQAALALDAAELLPFRAAFDRFAVNYLDWLHARDAEGWRFFSGEVELRCEPSQLGGVVLDGRIDRIDDHPAGGMRQLIDYKTGSLQALKRKVATPLEDTQLAFYAALLGGGGPLRATYLALDDRKQPQAVEHPDVQASATALVEGLAHDLARLREGAGLPALGEGSTCDYCEARGLCRRDHWGEVAA